MSPNNQCTIVSRLDQKPLHLNEKPAMQLVQGLQLKLIVPISTTLQILNKALLLVTFPWISKTETFRTQGIFKHFVEKWILVIVLFLRPQ